MFVPENRHFPEQMPRNYKFVPKIKGFWEQMYWKGCLKSVQGARYTATGALIAGQGS